LRAKYPEVMDMTKPCFVCGSTENLIPLRNVGDTNFVVCSSCVGIYHKIEGVISGMGDRLLEESSSNGHKSIYVVKDLSLEEIDFWDADFCRIGRFLFEDIWGMKVDDSTRSRAICRLYKYYAPLFRGRFSRLDPNDTNSHLRIIKHQSLMIARYLYDQVHATELLPNR